jgi:dipeptidase E
MMELHLFSTPGPGLDITWVLDACREVLRDRREASIAYLPQASLDAQKWLRETQRVFRDVARIDMIDTETTDLPDMEAILRRAALAYIPGGNAFLLNHRLHASQLAPHLRKKVQNGLPLVAFSAGAVACGPNILTSNDLNLIPTTHFNGLALIPFNLNVHYDDGAERDDWLSDFRSFHDDPVIMLADGAYLKISGKVTALVRGEAWLWRARQDKVRLTPGEPIAAN